jgi:membrane protease YdiL (CAAX protease family)
MDPRTFFINDHGRLRSGLRILVFVLLFIAAIMASDVVLYRVHLSAVPHGDFILEVVRRAFLLACAFAAGYICCRFLESLPWRSLGLTFHRGWVRDFAIGTAIGVLTLCFAVLVATALGGLRFTLTTNDVLVAMIKSVGVTAVLFVVAALAEEAMFRGYPLQTLSRANLAWLGVLLTSVPFALIHLWNPHVVRGITFTNTALAGVWLAIAYLRTRSLWLPLGIHWSWNWALGSIFGLPVSGMTLSSHPIFQGKDFGPQWLTGGTYGIEGGAACTIALILSSLFLWRTHVLCATPELLELTTQEVPR